jgi:hypothetical protein
MVTARSVRRAGGALPGHARPGGPRGGGQGGTSTVEVSTNVPSGVPASFEADQGSSHRHDHDRHGHACGDGQQRRREPAGIALAPAPGYATARDRAHPPRPLAIACDRAGRELNPPGEDPSSRSSCRSLRNPADGPGQPGPQQQRAPHRSAHPSTVCGPASETAAGGTCFQYLSTGCRCQVFSMASIWRGGAASREFRRPRHGPVNLVNFTVPRHGPPRSGHRSANVRWNRCGGSGG